MILQYFFFCHVSYWQLLTSLLSRAENWGPKRVPCPRPTKVKLGPEYSWLYRLTLVFTHSRGMPTASCLSLCWEFSVRTDGNLFMRMTKLQAEPYENEWEFYCLHSEMCGVLRRPCMGYGVTNGIRTPLRAVCLPYFDLSYCSC